MRKIHAAGPVTAALALVLGSGSARAQARAGRQPGVTKQAGAPQTLVLQKQQLGTDAFAIVARTRMRNGDCEGALDAFDAAIAHSIDVTLHRDRGLCHEQLGHPFPAMEDYRAYLKLQPEAPDAEGIRARLARLEGGDAPAPETTAPKTSADDDVPPGMSSSGSFQVADVEGREPDKMDYVEHDNDVLGTPLRRGKGFSFGPYFAEHKWFFQGSSFGESDTWAECVGLQLRYSLGHTTTLFIEGAYQHFNSTTASTDTANADVSGLSSQLGVEFRIPLDAEYNNQLLLAPGLGFEALVATYNVVGLSTLNLAAFVPRARVGWRHMLSTSVGFDLALDLGVGKFVQFGDFPLGGGGQATALLAVNAGLAWGL